MVTDQQDRGERASDAGHARDDRPESSVGSRRRFTFSLRFFLLVVALVCSGCAFVASQLRAAERGHLREQQIKEKLESVGIDVTTRPRASAIARLFRPEVCDRICYVGIPGDVGLRITQSEILRLLKSCTNLESVSLVCVAVGQDSTGESRFVSFGIDHEDVVRELSRVNVWLHD